MNWFRRGFFFSVIFLLFTIPVSLGFFSQFDRSVTSFLQSWLPLSLDTFLSLFSLLGSFELTTIILFATIHKIGWKKCLPILLLFASGMVLELFGKNFVYHPGPEKIYFRYDLDIYFPSGNVITQHSYPSGHSYRSTFLVVLLTHLFSVTNRFQKQKRAIATFLYFLLIVMLISRVSLGEHWATDVVGGVFLGLGLAHLSLRSISHP